MFLHAGAGLHGHEYSDRSSQSGHSPAKQPTRPRHPLLRTAWRPLAPPESAPSNPRPLSHHGLPNRKSTASPDESPRLSSLTSSRRAASGGFVKKDLAVRFYEPQIDPLPTPTASEDDASVLGSEFDNSVDGSIHRTRRKRAPRKSTRFALAHPAPQLRTKQRRLVQIRPRLFLQLQEVGDRRAIPSFDVVPSSLVAGSLIIPQLAKRFPRMFGVKHELGQDDVLMVRSDDYGSSSSGSTSVTDKDVLAVIGTALQQGSSRAEIALEDGSTWLASPMANGSFEFTSIDEQGNTTTARWVRRSLLSNRNSLGSATGTVSPQSDSSGAFKWTFSIIDPSTRRHPIMGTLTPESVEVYDSYTTLSASSGRFPPSRPFSPDGSIYATSPSSPSQDERATVDVTPAQKALMLASATWISLHERGWPAIANPKFSRALSHGRSVSADVSGRRRTFNGFESAEACATRHSWVPFSDKCSEASTKSQREVNGVPARAMSTGRAFMKRRRGRADVGTKDEPKAAKSTISSLDGQPQGKWETKAELACRPKLREWIHRVWDRAGSRDKKRERELIKRKLELE
ncbi:hypothetical protein HIM_06884 [Hirsutella minnesotensis 3608]|uniref:Uncharacterized protein n=1 Tax=Hirsutella minnesotensis 3608 TaxID=1043627 RepID=A0A0F7ZIJ4_9HYPO|nr:hypothetical protein HIM_06884 [Hirsutella minnesotensis 3608]